MRLSHRLLVTGTSIGVLVGLALYPRTSPPTPSDLVSHGYQAGYGYGRPCPISLSLGVFTHRVVQGTSMRFIGDLGVESGFSPASQPIKFFQALFGTGFFTQISGAITNSGGSYVKTGFPSKNATYKSQWGPLVGPPLWCPAVVSGRATILVLFRVPWLFGERPTEDDPVLVYGSVRPARPGQRVVFRWRRLGDATFRYRTVTLDGLSNFFVNFVFDRPGIWNMRVTKFGDTLNVGNFLERNFTVAT